MVPSSLVSISLLSNFNGGKLSVTSFNVMPIHKVPQTLIYINSLEVSRKENVTENRIKSIIKAK